VPFGHDGVVLPHRLSLVRHGRSSHVHTSGWVDATGVGAWRDAYEAAGIREDEEAPGSLAALAAQADLVACSDAARAIESARRLIGEREILVSPLLRELDLHCPRLGGISLPLAAWSVAIGGRRLADAMRGGPSETERARVAEAAAWLDGLAAGHASIVVVTHASFRQALAVRLSRAGWRAEPGRRTWRPWSAWHYSRGS
jgi:broad specificity phosphatase PhoE